MTRDKNLLQIKKIIFKYDKVQKVILFGSRARSDNDSRSDIDLAIDCPNMDDNDYRNLVTELREARIILKLDIHRFDKLGDDEFKNRILKEGTKL